MRAQVKRAVAALACGAAALAAFAPAAQGASSEPLFVFKAAQESKPGGEFEGPCGLGVDTSGDFYVADYYHRAVDIYNSSHVFQAQLTGLDALDGPCGLALDSTNHLYVNDYHRAVTKFNATPSFGTGTAIAGVGVDSADPTGVAVDLATNRVYVDDRTYVAVYESSGAPVEHIGEGSLINGYGAAYANGRLYVADAGSDTVKVYEPATSTTIPVASVSGPGGGFKSLRDAAVAVDRSSGNLYVADDLQPSLTEQPEAVIDVFSAAGAYLGRLKYGIVDALPPGLAVDNSGGPTQSRVYVTSGNTTQASVYAYGPEAQTGSGLPATLSLAVGVQGSGDGTVSSSQLPQLDCQSSCEEGVRGGATVTLDASPAAGSAFLGWSGAGCSGSGSCTLQMDRAQQVSAEFGPGAAAPAPEPGPAAPPPLAAAGPAKHRARHTRHRRHHHPRHAHRRRTSR